jgi:hypothetical protein
MGARNRAGIRLSFRPARLHRLAESIPGRLKFLQVRALFRLNFKLRSILRSIRLFLNFELKSILFLLPGTVSKRPIPRTAELCIWRGELNDLLILGLNLPIMLTAPPRVADQSAAAGANLNAADRKTSFKLVLKGPKPSMRYSLPSFFLLNPSLYGYRLLRN